MKKASGNEFCSWCHLGTSKGETLLEGSDNDAGALYHGDCYGALCRAEDGEFDGPEDRQRFAKWKRTTGAR